MRDPVVALYVLTALALGTSAVLVKRVNGARSALATVIVQLVVIALAALALPLVSSFFQEKLQQQLFVGAVLAAQALAAAAGVAPSRPFERVATLMSSRPRLASVTFLVVSVTLVLGSMEIVASSAVRAGLTRRYTPTETRVAEQTEDWRLAHIINDDYREPDPTLLWRPVARPPYTAQRFRGPVVAANKAPATTRIICYGDSNTDGPRSGGAWPDALGAAIATASLSHSRSIEVLNAGVTGYSSYQGRRRFEQDVVVYKPDVVLVSFGWNDAATAIGAEDKQFATTSAFQSATPWMIQLRRLAFRYDTVLVAARWLTPARTFSQATGDEVGPRVSIDDYAANLTAVVQEGRAHATRVVLMTRPHRASPEELAASGGWRRRVPEYNETVRRVAAATDTPVVDAQRAFADAPEAFVDESHLSVEGHRRLAEIVTDHLVVSGLLQ